VVEFGAARCEYHNGIVGSSWCVDIVFTATVPLTNFEFELSMCPAITAAAAGGGGLIPSLADDELGAPGGDNDSLNDEADHTNHANHTNRHPNRAILSAKGGLAHHAGFKIAIQPAKKLVASGGGGSAAAVEDAGCSSFRVLGYSIRVPADARTHASAVSVLPAAHDAQLLTRLLLPMSATAGALTNEHISSAKATDPQFADFLPPGRRWGGMGYVPEMACASAGVFGAGAGLR
jgi:hypothetical protein